jgi:hypothetical protein
MFVARDDHEEVKIIVCPLPDCRYTWCKACQQPIDCSGPKHSCDGTAELDSLMKRNGWKYCPSEPARAHCYHLHSDILLIVFFFFLSVQDADPEKRGM